MNHQDTKGTKVGGRDGCALLDDYLDGELDAGEGAAFEGHLVGCAACAEAVEQQRWMDGLLQSPVAAELEAAPSAALAATGRAIRHRRRRVLTVAALAAAIAAVVAWPLSSLFRREGLGEDLKSVVADSGHHFDAAVEHSSPSPSRRDLGNSARPAAEFVSTGDAIVVPVESSSEEVTIVQVYTTVNAQRRMHINAALSSLTLEPNGG